MPEKRGADEQVPGKRAADKRTVDPGGVEETLFIPLAARAREAHRKRPIISDPKAAEIAESADFDAARYGRGWGSIVMVLRTAIFDSWVRRFLAEHPAGTVTEIGAGLNTRFERVDNGSVHWIDLDLPDTIELRRKFFTDSARRRMIAASVLDERWLDTVRQSPGPYFFVADGVLVYLPEDGVKDTLSRIADRFPGALIAFDTYPGRTFDQQRRMAAKRNIAQWAWPCDDPRSLEGPELRMLESTSISRPPLPVRAQLPPRDRYLLRLADPVLSKTLKLSLFKTTPPA